MAKKIEDKLIPIAHQSLTRHVSQKAGIHAGPRRRGIGASSGGFRIFVLALAIATAGGCGYQLRGAVSLPPDLDAVHIDGPPEVAAALTRMLDSGGIRIQGSDPARAVLRLSDERFSRRLLSVDPNTGKEREFELAYRVAFQLTGAGGEVLVPKQSVSLLRDYIFDADAVLGKSREQDVLRAEMRRDAAGQIARRLATALGR